MDALPTEIYLHISGLLTIRELARLNQCSRAINNRWESTLLSIPVARDQLMYWGCCHGQTWAIQKAISYGAKLSAVDVWSNFEIAENPLHSARPNPQDTRSTLVLAAEQDDLAAYEFLLRSGVRIDPAVNRGQPWELLVSCLFNFQRPEPLRLYLQYGGKRDVPYFHNELDRTLRKAVFSHAGEDICQAWLDLGANPLAIGGGHGSERSGSALAMAMETGPVSLARLLRTWASADLLLNRFYSFANEGARFSWRDEPASCVSILAAAQSLADSGLTDMIDLSLEAHENINTTIVAELDLHGKRHWYMVNAVMAYVFRVDFNRAQQDGVLSPSEGLQYLIHKGALFTHTNPSHIAGYPTKSILLLFWNKWNGLYGLLQDEVYAMLRILARKKAAPGTLLGFLCSIRSDAARQRKLPTQHERIRLSVITEYHNIVTSRWRSLLDLLLVERNCCLIFQDELNNLLFNHLVHTMKLIVDLDIKLTHESNTLESPVSDCSTAECEVLIIQKLINKGADIRWKPTWGEYKGHSILDWIARSCIRNHGILQHPAIELNQQRSFVNTLIRLGAERPDDALSHILSVEGNKFERWARFVFGEVPEEEVLLWNSKAGLLFEGDSVATRPEAVEQASVVSLTHSDD
ncbi:unnamed protein product [Clonostachys rosea]|uniref:F-box domain-containing protein n=1 Tax=Bionectria ochroleuca TaxID=29856 RepID=A0ABY6UNE5_BIOOC|nr:unnamed protein product [Clonostachys rosea]